MALDRLGLTNEELLYIYMYLQEDKKDLDTIVQKGVKRTPMDPFGRHIHEEILSKEEIRRYREGTDYRLLSSIVKKLSIYAQIIESSSEDFSQVQRRFKEKDNEI